ncbi:MAG TPA: hypothetical protein VHG08_05250 [Longimicrobium sp.]|nr:hypothetical protein [Longimicrobium sp.]
MVNGRGGFGAVAGMVLCGAMAGCRGPDYPVKPGPSGGHVWVLGDSARLEIRTGPTERRWTWNQPWARDRAHGAGVGAETRALQYAWWVRVRGRVPHELGVYQQVDPAGATRRDWLPVLLREARTCVCPVGGDGDREPVGVRGESVPGAALTPVVHGGRLVLVLRGKEAVKRVFAGRPDSVTVYRAIPWPRVDSVRVGVSYEARFEMELKTMTEEPVDG